MPPSSQRPLQQTKRNAVQRHASLRNRSSHERNRTIYQSRPAGSALLVETVERGNRPQKRWRPQQPGKAGDKGRGWTLPGRSRSSPRARRTCKSYIHLISGLGEPSPLRGNDLEQTLSVLTAISSKKTCTQSAANRIAFPAKRQDTHWHHARSWRQHATNGKHKTGHSRARTTGRASRM